MAGRSREHEGARPSDRLCGVAAAQAVGWPSALVFTGATGVPELAIATVWPDFVLRRLSDVLADLPHPQLRGATGPDLPAIAQLLHDGGLPAGAARERVARTVVAQADRSLIATASWEPAEDAAFLRSVAVAPEVRGMGTGLLVSAAALRQIAREGIRDVYLVANDAAAEAFFARCGFHPIAREELPSAVSAHKQITRECPSTATVMRLVLPLG